MQGAVRDQAQAAGLHRAPVIGSAVPVRGPPTTSRSASSASPTSSCGRTRRSCVVGDEARARAPRRGRRPRRAGAARASRPRPGPRCARRTSRARRARRSTLRPRRPRIRRRPRRRRRRRAGPPRRRRRAAAAAARGGPRRASRAAAAAPAPPARRRPPRLPARRRCSGAAPSPSCGPSGPPTPARRSRDLPCSCPWPCETTTSVDVRRSGRDRVLVDIDPSQGSRTTADRGARIGVTQLREIRFPDSWCAAFTPATSSGRAVAQRVHSQCPTRKRFRNTPEPDSIIGSPVRASVLAGLEAA